MGCRLWEHLFFENRVELGIKTIAPADFAYNIPTSLEEVWEMGSFFNGDEFALVLVLFVLLVIVGCACD